MDVQVDQIQDVSLDTAFWSQGSLMLRRGATLPASLEALYRRPVCAFPGNATVTGQWLGVTSRKKVRFDGDLPTPLRIELYVEKVDNPNLDLERYTIHIRDRGAARPALDRDMAKRALWSSRAALQVVLECVDGRYQAVAFGLEPR